MVSPSELHAMLGDEAELALLDVREERCFGAAHLLYASCVALSRLELRAGALVPRRATRIVVCDAGEGLAQRAAGRLGELGYTDVACLEGGIAGWRDAGFELFSGVNVPSKAFGEHVEEQYATPSLSADELQGMLAAGEDVVVLDSRPLVEYRARHIPGGICCPGVELVYRVYDAAPRAETLVVVNCAGRTRSIIGAQSLINAGIPNRVAALRNGTMGWHLAGHALESGVRREAGEVSPAGLKQARAAAAPVAARYGVRSINRTTLAAWRDECEQRTLYVFDVRRTAEYLAGHLPGTRCAPGGQLIQETDQFAATLRSRIVLVDDTGVRAAITASWLRQMGWPEVAVLEGGLDAAELETGPERVDVLGLESTAADQISPEALQSLLDTDGAVVIDLALSRAYRRGHIPGAIFCVRARLAATLASIPLGSVLVLTSEDGVLARLTAEDARRLAGSSAKVLAGGNAAWHAAGQPMAEGLAEAADDVWLRPYERDWGVEQAMRDYLEWEVALVPQVRRDGVARYLGARGTAS